jgi:hypothetical protein
LTRRRGDIGLKRSRLGKRVVGGSEGGSWKKKKKLFSREVKRIFLWTPFSLINEEEETHQGKRRGDSPRQKKRPAKALMTILLNSSTIKRTKRRREQRKDRLNSTREGPDNDQRGQTRLPH